MKIIDDTLLATQVTDVESAKYIGDFVIRVLFSDGTEQVVDFKPFLNKSSHPVIRKYLNERKFQKFRITHGNINWNDFELIFPIDDLYNGKII